MTYSIPSQGSTSAEVLSQLVLKQERDVTWRDGKTLAYVFHATKEAEHLAEEAYRRFMWVNALDPTVFPSSLSLETEIVSMAATHLRGDDQVVGNFTSGGTESVMLAVKTARDHARVHRPHIKRPAMVLPVTAHPCFHKAAHYFGLETIITRVDPLTCKADPEAMRAAITPDTVLLVASAPSYSHGCIDPVEEIGAIAEEHGLLLHVDGCIGAFLLPFFRDLGMDVPDFDFTVPGVTSMSMDFHKYAYCPKGASVVLYRNADLRKHQIFSYSGWPGYSIINTTMQSSKSGGPMAGCWAMLHHLGREGYLGIAEALVRARGRFLRGIAAIPELTIIGEPNMTLFAVGSDSIDAFALTDELKRRGWTMHAQLESQGIPANFHVNLIPLNDALIDEFLDVLRDAIEAVREADAGPVVAMVRQALEGFDPADVSDEQLYMLLQMVGLGGGDLPDGEMAEINHILNELTPELRDRVLTLYFNELSRYHPAECEALV